MQSVREGGERERWRKSVEKKKRREMAVEKCSDQCCFFSSLFSSVSSFFSFFSSILTAATAVIKTTDDKTEEVEEHDEKRTRNDEWRTRTTLLCVHSRVNFSSVPFSLVEFLHCLASGATTILLFFLLSPFSLSPSLHTRSSHP